MNRVLFALGLAMLVPTKPVRAQDGPSTAAPTVQETFLELDDGTILRYAVALPAGHLDATQSDARPLVLALHPGGRSPSYGRWFMESTVEPALRSWGAVMVAPDVPDRSWTTPLSERALLALIERVFAEYAIDRGKVLVTGFSMGGRGTWYMAATHPDVFTGAIVMAGAPGEARLDDLAPVPLYLIHSPDDEVVPFLPVRETYDALAARGRDVALEVLPGVSHYTMGAYVPALREAAAWMLARWGGG
jgi:predicted peptidase